MDVKLRVSGEESSTGTLLVVGPNGLNGTAPLPVSCGEFGTTVTIRTSELPNYVKYYEPMQLQWSARPDEDSGYVSAGSTYHDTYITYGTPAGSHATKTRLRWLCDKAFGFGTAETIVSVIHSGLDWEPPYDGQGDPAYQASDWRLMSGLPYQGECHEQAHLFNLAIRLIGAGAGTEFLLLASSDTNIPTTTTLQTFFNDVEKISAAQLGITQDLDEDGTPGEQDEILELIFDFNPPGNPGPRNINNFEGSVKLPSGYYAVWPSLKAPTACCLLLQLRDGVDIPSKQYWGYRLPSGGFGYIHYAQEVPFPTCPTTCP